MTSWRVLRAARRAPEVRYDQSSHEWRSVRRMCRERQFGRSRPGRMARPRRCAGLRADGAMDWSVRKAGHGLPVHARGFVAQWDGAHVHTHEHLSCGAMDEVNLEPTNRCPLVSTRRLLSMSLRDPHGPLSMVVDLIIVSSMYWTKVVASGRRTISGIRGFNASMSCLRDLFLPSLHVAMRWRM